MPRKPLYTKSLEDLQESLSSTIREVNDLAARLPTDQAAQSTYSLEDIRQAYQIVCGLISRTAHLRALLREYGERLALGQRQAPSTA